MLETELNLLYRCPENTVDVVIDTDTYNEVDDQFAIAYALRNPKINIKGFTVAPFRKSTRVKDTAEGLQKSREEIELVLKLCGNSDLKGSIFIGGENFMRDENTPVESGAARYLIEASRGYTKTNRLYILAIGAITNIASAILFDPSIVDRICVVWLGGSALGWWTNNEYNMHQDVAAARVVMGSHAAFVKIPAHGVTSVFSTTRYELEYWLRDKNTICDYLLSNCISYSEAKTKHRAWSRVIWDVLAPAYLLNEDERFMSGSIINRVLPSADSKTYEQKPLDHKMFYIHQINRDALMSDLFEKLAL